MFDSAVELSALGADPRRARAATMIVARHLELPLADAALLLERLPVTLPRRATKAQAAELAGELGDAGATASTVDAPFVASGCCESHPSLSARDPCQRCQAPTCALCCAQANGEPLCARCRHKRRRGRTFYRVRVAVLLVVLAGVLLYAWRDYRSRTQRLDWNQPLTVGIVLLSHGTVDEEALAELRTRTSELQRQLAAECRRHRPGAPEPFHFVMFGPVDVSAEPPAPAGDGWLDQARHSYALWRYLRPVDDGAGVAARGLDARLYLVLRAPAGETMRTVEGMGEQGGRVGIVTVELDETMADFALFVAAHELFHTLGATDKYDAAGRPLVPDGLAEPERQPLYPQRYAELMARHVALSPSTHRPPETLAELRIGSGTAREIGWLDSPP